MAFTYGFPQQQGQTPSAIARKRAIAESLLGQGMSTAPVGHWTQAIARALQGAAGGYMGTRADEADAALTRQKELETATERAKAEAEKRNTPEFRELSDGSIVNWNSYMAEGGKPVVLSQARQKADEWKKLNDGMMYRQGADGQPEYAPVPGAAAESGTPYANEFSKQYAKDSAKKNAETARKITDAGLDAQNQLNNLDRMQQLTSDPDVYQGTGAQFTLPIRRAVSNIPGLNSIIPYSNPDEVAKADELNSLSNTMALMVRNPDAGLGMPGALSDKDREFLVSTVPGLSRSPGGNKLMIEAAKRVQQRKIEIAEFKAEYVQQNGQIDDRFFEIVSKWASENPLFDDIGNLPNMPKIAPKVGTVKTDSEGQNWSFKGGDPSRPESWEPVP